MDGPKGHFVKDPMRLAGCQINPIDVNFHLQKSLEIFDKNYAGKFWSKKWEGVESTQTHAN